MAGGKPTAIPGPFGRRRRRPGSLTALASPPLIALRALLPRVLDLGVAGLAAAGLTPLLVARGALARWQTGRTFEREPRVGRYRQPFELLRFAGAAPGASLARLLNILRGDMALAGPRPLTPEEAEAVPVSGRERFLVRPGCVSSFLLRRRVGIDYDDEHVADRNDYYAETLRHDLGLVARGALGSVFGGRASGDAGGVEIRTALDFFGVPVVNTTMDEALDWIEMRVERREQSLLAFVNPDCLNISCRDAGYREVLQCAERVLPDGIGIHIGCKMLGTELRANVNGTDLFPRLCERLAASGRSLFLLGARPQIAELVAENMRRRYPALRIAGTQHGYFDAREEPAVIDRINASGADVLLVAFGVPRQERWLARHRAALRPSMLMGVGGLFDFYSGRIPRAPQWLRELGLEWVWRLMQEPGRMWRRYVIGNPLFLFRVWRQAGRQRRHGGV